MIDIKKETHAEARESSNHILPTINTNVQHLEELRNAAKEYVTRGLPIVPVGYNHGAQNYKLPLIRWEKDGPLKSVDDIDRAFDKFKGRIFGIATIVDGYTMVDFDTRDTPGLFNGLEPTATIETGKGYHYWYKAGKGLTQNGSVDLSEYEKRDGKKYQLEIYTQKRLDIIPPSKHHSGVNYEWLIQFEGLSNLSEFPDSLAKLCEGIQRTSNDFLTEVVSEGGRNLAIVKVAGHYARQFNGDREKLGEHTHQWNKDYCVPPLEDEEVANVVAWAADTYKELDNKDKKSKRRQIETILMDTRKVQLFHDQNNEAYARIHFKGRAMNVPVDSNEFRDYAQFLLYKETKESVSRVHLDGALSLCSAKAIFEGEQHCLYHRVAQVGNAIYYDLLNDEGEVVKIDAEGWSILSNSEIPFLFKVGQGKEQVRPIRGGDLNVLADLINIEDPREKMLFLCTLPVRLLRDVDQAIAYVHGPAGSGKSTLIKLSKELLDPSFGGISMPIRKVEDAIPLLSQTWIFANDNISRINNDLSDFFCVVATGAEHSRRKLYTTGGLAVFSLKNPVFLDGINVEAYKSDLMSRILVFKTQAMSTEEKENDSDIWDKFTELKPLLLGAVFDTLSKAIRVKESITHKTEFRMSDFSIWGAACAEVLGYGATSFEEAIKKSVHYSAYDSIYSHTSGRALLEMLETEDGFEGTSSELLDKLKKTNNYFDWTEDVAKNPSALGKRLRELENSLAAIGIILRFRRNGSKERIISIQKVDSNDDRSDR